MVCRPFSKVRVPISEYFQFKPEFAKDNAITPSADGFALKSTPASIFGVASSGAEVHVADGAQWNDLAALVAGPAASATNPIVVGKSPIVAGKPERPLMEETDGDEPASTAYLPAHGVFVRWCAADSEADLLAGVPSALAPADWGHEVHWKVPGPVVLFDSAWPGGETERTEHLRVPLTPGTYAVRAAHARPGPETWLILVQLRRLAH